MSKEQKGATWKETFTLLVRCTKDIYGYCPSMYWISGARAVVDALAPYVTIYMSAQIINELAHERRPDVLMKWVIWTLLLCVVTGLLQAVVARMDAAVKTKFNPMQERLFMDKYFDMDYADVDNQKVRDLRAQIIQTAQWQGWGINMTILCLEGILRHGFGILGAIALTLSMLGTKVPETETGFLWLNHPLTVLVAACAVALIVGCNALLAGRIDRAYVGLAEKSRFGNRVHNHFGFLGRDIDRAMDMRMYNQAVISKQYKMKYKMFGKGSCFAKAHAGEIGICYGLIEGSNALIGGIIYLFVGLKAWAGAFGVGSVTQYVGAITALVTNANEFVMRLGELRSNTTFLRTVYEFLDIPNNMYQGSLTTEKRADRQYEVEFRDVSFKYPGSDLWALRHVNMKFKVGSRLAVVGENGSGKTTFIKLLCRLYDPQEGQILLNGIDIRKYNYRDYMDIFSVVFQDFQLLSQPLGANVAGSATYDKERVLKALIDAGFGERLTELEDGLDTVLYKDFDKKGVDVSGGEAQKIAIARALYKDAPFIILDEPTAALDPIAEAEIYSKFNDIAGDKTAIYISHRLSSCKFCDEIAVFHEGKVVQQGSHEDLVHDTNGKYHELWNAQAQYYV